MCFVQIGENDLWNRQFEGTRDFARDQLGRQREQAVARRLELEHVQAVVVGLDERRERSAFAERGHVARDPHGSKRAHAAIVSRGYFGAT